MLYLMRPPQTTVSYHRQLRHAWEPPKLSNAERAQTLVKVLQATIDGDSQTLRVLCCPDLQVWTPELIASSVDEVIADIALRDAAFNDFSADIVPLDVGGSHACAEWFVTMTHYGTFRFANRDVAATGAGVSVYGATVASFRNERISGLRQYWDEVDLLSQLGVGV